MKTFEFMWMIRGDILRLTGEHLVLVGVSIALAIAIGGPLGVLMTRRPD